MARRGYKLQEFVAHSTNVNCLNIGKKACRLFITGGDDHKVNLWAIGKPTSLMSLCGHTSPVESVAFDTAEVLVLAGASAGVIKLWDLEESKMVRTLPGHRSNCTAIEFHPFGEFFASGSMDTNLKIWDIRKKGCIHTYKGHTRGISTIRFTPDGRWVVSGGFDNVVKVWDLTAGKLLHDFKFHEGHIRSIDFHPLEFLLATGSADRTVKFWDLETFELIGSARPEATGVRTISFHPDGRTLFCGLDDSLKVYSWEPLICHDAVDMGWSTLGDLCINEGKLLGCSYYRNCVGVWVADISLFKPYVAGFLANESDCNEKKFNIPTNHSSDKVRNGVRSASGLHSRSPDYETKEIKNIYVDSTDANPVTPQRVGSPKAVLPLDSKQMIDPPTEKQSPLIGVNAKSSEQALNKCFVVPTVVPRDRPIGKDTSNSGRETITFSRTKPGMLLRPAHIRRPSNSKNDIEKLPVSLESENFSNVVSENESVMDRNLETQTVSEDGAQKSSEGKSSGIKSVAEKFEKILSLETPSNQENRDESSNGSKISSVKIVNGVAVVAGRTRTLVERFERRERFSNGDQATNMTQIVLGMNSSSAIVTNMSPSETDRTASIATSQVISNTDRTTPSATHTTPCVIPETDTIVTHVSPRVIPETDRTPNIESNMISHVKPTVDRTPPVAINMASQVSPTTDRAPSIATNMTSCVIPTADRAPPLATTMTSCVIPTADRAPPIATTMTFCVTPTADRAPPIATDTITHIVREIDRSPVLLESGHPTDFVALRMMTIRTSLLMNEEPQISGRDPNTASYRNVIEDLMQSHDAFLSTLKSRLTKLQVVRHFWERNDLKGAINALRKLPDHSLQADVIGVLMEKIEILTLDLFSCLLPVLVGLLDSKMERHANISLEILLKLVAVFGPVIRSTILAPPAVGVDLHQEQRLECCNQCFNHLQKIQQILPALIRRGGLLAKGALELNLVLQES